MSYYQPLGYQGILSNYYNNQAMYQQPQNQYQAPQQEVLQGAIVDSVDVVRSKNCNLDGTPSYYPKTDKTEIYCKQLNPQTGTGVILTYKLVDTTLPSSNNNTDLSEQIMQLQSDIAELKNIMLENITAPTPHATKGGVKNV
jgi:hypothetical protein